ncbi:MAG: nitrogenase iron-molybdenum cofactor biosynthesis protein NifN [Rhodoplanes sp.]
MTKVTAIQKAASINPLKSSQPLGAAFAFLGVEGAMPLFHGSQGCTSFALVLFVRHFKETIPLQTTALDEVATILGGADHLEEALLNLKARANPKLIGVCTTALVETRGEDFAGDLATIKQRRACELAGTEVVLVQTPDFDGAIEEGWSKAVTSLIDNLVPPETPQRVLSERINILPGCHLTVADVELLRDTAEAFGLEPNIVPDISGALDGTVPDRWIPTTYGGAPVGSIRTLGEAAHTIAVGEHMRRPAQRLADIAGVPFTLFESLASLASADLFITLLAQLSGRSVPARIRRRRRQLEDALLDGHFFFSGRRIAIAAEPDQLYALATFVSGLGAEVPVAVTTTAASPVLAKVPAREVKVGDLGDFEDLACSAECDLLLAHSHGRQAAERLGVPLMRVGFPIFDRLGSQHRRTILYEGVRDLVFEVANVFQAHPHIHTSEQLDPLGVRGDCHDGHPQIAHH